MDNNTLLSEIESLKIEHGLSNETILQVLQDKFCPKIKFTLELNLKAVEDIKATITVDLESIKHRAKMMKLGIDK
jgi:hypothetical protein